MENSNPPALTEREEILLSAFIDDECTSVERVRAEQLVKSNPAARSFVDAMRTVGAQISDARSELGFESVDLWDRVSSRMVQEERTAVLLGSRQTALEAARASRAEVEKGSWISNVVGWFDLKMAFGGISGAAAAACILFLVNNNSTVGTPSTAAGRLTDISPGGTAGLGISTVGLSGSGKDPSGVSRVRPRMVFNSNARSVEVDWARGNGPLKFIQGPNERSTIIWVKRRGNRADPGTAKFQNRAGVIGPVQRETARAQ